MKRIISMLACAALVVCSCQKDPKPELSFESGNYVMGADEAVKVKVVASEAPAADLTVGFTASGTAVKGSDYELSAESFTIKAGETSGEITISPKNNVGSSLNINLALTLPAGYIAGDFASTIVAVGSKEKIAYSFAQKETKLVDEVDIVLNLIGETSGANFVAGGEIVLPFTIDAASTATAADYEVKDGATAFVFAKGSKSAKITLKSKLAEGAKEVIIKLDETAVANAYGERFSAGVNASTKAVITKQLIFLDLVGKWAYASTPILDDPEADCWTLGALLEEVGDGGFNEEFTGIDIFGFPTGTSSDVLEFKYEDGKQTLEPTGTGAILNYFKKCEVSGFTPKKYAWYFYPGETEMGKEYDVVEIDLSKANVTYSATAAEERAAKILVNLSEDKNTLNVFIADYVPTDFFTFSYEFWSMMEMWGDYSFYYDLYFTFTRVTE